MKRSGITAIHALPDVLRQEIDQGLHGERAASQNREAALSPCDPSIPINGTDLFALPDQTQAGFQGLLGVAGNVGEHAGLGVQTAVRRLHRFSELEQQPALRQKLQHAHCAEPKARGGMGSQDRCPAGAPAEGCQPGGSAATLVVGQHPALQRRLRQIAVTFQPVTRKTPGRYTFFGNNESICGCFYFAKQAPRQNNAS